MAEKEEKKEEATKVATEKKAEKAEKPVKEEKSEPKAKKSRSRSKKRNVPEGAAHIQASYNNTIVTLTEPNGNVIAWSSAGASGFKGARKATPYAAQISAENAAQKASAYGLERVHVYVKGVGTGREQAIRGLVSSGINIISINDVTPIPHNGCRKKKQRRM
ncbi:MAG: 30S ribosomal protein S11 [Nitrospirae bacterium]|nr:30S ribosomal protein S11 [Nitrospirota bacterium]